MKDTVLIAYSPGTYGTYLEWCLTTLSTTDAIEAPFSEFGGSHNFPPLAFSGVDSWNEYLESSAELPFARLHVKSKQGQDLYDLLSVISTQCSSIVYLYSTDDTVLLTINNLFYKVYNNWTKQILTTELDPDVIYKNWPVSSNCPLESLPTWVEREFLSLYLMPAWLDQVEFGRPNFPKLPNLLKISIDNLLYNFEDTVSSIQQFCNLQFNRPVSDIIPYHKQNLKLQQFLNQDAVCQQVIKSIKNNIEYQWSKLTIVSEAWIQWQLRNLGFEIQCHGLDIFPTNSVHLKELLYSI